mmetsp:Transcript_69621/g.196354  ORF Transcript_69621/g.196354 Transcript_69621/m.196354 type:complete len:583 (+) Transcript_69621:75-1823(+)
MSAAVRENLVHISHMTDLAAQEFVRRPINIKERPQPSTGQKIWAGIFYGQLAVQLLAVIWMLASANVALVSGDTCPAGFDKMDFLCVTSRLKAEAEACVLETTADATRRLAGEGNSRTIWKMLLDNFITLGLTLPAAAAVLGAAWLTLLKMATPYAVWGMILLNVLLMFYGSYLVENFALAVYGVFTMVVAVLSRKQIHMAVAAVRVACQALNETKSVVMATAGVQLLSVCYSACFLLAATRVGNSLQLGPDCTVTELSLASKFFSRTCPLLFFVTTAYFKNCVLAICSLGVGCWYFPDRAEEEGVPPTNPSVLGAKLAFTTSSGTVCVASLVIGVVDYLRARTQDGPCWWCDPMACVVRSLWCCLDGVVGGLSRFALITHMLHGQGLREVAAVTYGLLKRRLPEAFMTSFVAEKVTSQMSAGLATVFGLAAWAILDASQGLGILRFYGDALGESASDGSDLRLKQLLVMGTIILMFFFVRHPMVSIVGIFFINNMFEITDDTVNSFSIAVLMGSMVAVIFSYFGILIECAADTIFYCFVLEDESGARQVRLKEVYDVVDAQMAIENKAAEANATNELEPQA